MSVNKRMAIKQQRSSSRVGKPIRRGEAVLAVLWSVLMEKVRAQRVVDMA